MDNDKRYNAKQHNAQVDRCKIIAIAVIFLASSIAIFATKYRQEIIDFGRDVNTKNVATKSDADRTEEKPTTEGAPARFFYSPAYILVDRYLNALSAMIIAIFFPAASGRSAMIVAAFKAAAADCPRNTPSLFTSLLPVS